MVNHRRHKNNIIGIYKEDRWLTQPQDIKTTFLDHFNNFLSRERDIPLFKIGTLQTNRITNEEKENLEGPFTIEEAVVALKESNSNKSPGANGINAACLKHCWNKIQNSFITVLARKFLYAWYSTRWTKLLIYRINT